MKTNSINDQKISLYLSNLDENSFNISESLLES